jgi:hypothetical protein
MLSDRNVSAREFEVVLGYAKEQVESGRGVFDCCELENALNCDVRAISAFRRSF